jgi:polysaccharide deacetylase 2 family uncharacterized protein YibQ
MAAQQPPRPEGTSPQPPLPMPPVPPLVPKPPVPGWFWLTLALLAGATLASLLAALWLPVPQPPHHAKPESRPAPLSPFISEFPAMPEQTEPEPALKPLPAPTAPAPSSSVPLWRLHSKAAAYAGVRGPRLALIIDDMGQNAPESREAAATLPAPVTFSFLAYGSATPQLAPQVYAAGHEVMIHLPMEPLPHPDMVLDPGPNTLMVGDDAGTIEAKLAQGVTSLLPWAVGANNHMGSRFTAWAEGMRTVLASLQDDGLFFLDSLTIAPTATRAADAGLTLPLLKRDVFLDDNPDPAVIAKQLQRAQEVARRNGFAVAIGHPLSTTLAVLREQLPTLTVSLVPISALLPPSHK